MHLHFPAEFDARVKQHCREQGVQMQDWIKRLIEAALPTPDKETLPKLSGEKHLDLWSRPPFWTKEEV